MANTLGVYNPVFYAQEALIQLEQALGMAGRVYMGYDEERRAFGKGETVNIRRPSTFTAADAPATAADITTETVAMTLNYWREVKFKLSDKELTFTGERIINDHIRPAAYALADDIDTKLSLLYKDVPWFADLGGTPGVSDITGQQQILFDNAVPQDDLHMMIDGKTQNSFLQLSAFSQQQGAGDAGVATQQRGTLGTKFGFEVFANQNVQTHTPGVSADAAGAVNGAGAVGDTTLVVDAFEASGTVKAGDILTLTGYTQKYVVTADASFSSGAATLSINPPLKTIVADNTVATLDLDATNVKQNLAFHRNAFGLVTAPLSDAARELGAKVATIQDPVTGLALRSRIYYVGNSSEVHVAIDVLYGVQTLDPNLASRLMSPV